MTDQNLDLSAYLAELEDTRDKLEIQIAGVRARLGLDPSERSGGVSGIRVSATGSVGREPVTGKVRSDEFFGMSIPEAVKRYLAIMKQPQGVSVITAALKAGGVLSESKNFYTTVWTAIKRLRDAGDIVNTKGGWGLSSWYPNRAKAPGDEKKPKRGKKRRKASKKPQNNHGASLHVTTSSNGLNGGYRTFLSEQMKAGKSMKEVNEAWRSKKAG